jgi:hypothetical protein
MKEREILGKANQNLLDGDRASHARPLHSKSPAQGRCSLQVGEVMTVFGGLRRHLVPYDDAAFHHELHVL